MPTSDRPVSNTPTITVHSSTWFRRAKKWVAGAIVAALAISGACAAATYNVAATEPHARPVEWVLASGMERSVKHHAADVEIPPGVDLRDPALAEGAIGHYSVACATCHGAPGEPRAPWMVMYPPPRELTDAEVVDRWTDGELYWIVKHGIKDTGMIALGPTHEDEDLWAVAAFVRQLPTMEAERYRALRAGYQGKMAAPSAHPHH